MGDTTKIAWTRKPGINSATGRPGPAPTSPRDGDKKQARHRVNVEVRTGRRPPPNALACADCGHMWAPGERRHEYDHHLGYSPDHHLDVQPVCTRCHAKRDGARAQQTHCVNGHEFNEKNTYIKANGTRMCRPCANARKKASRGD